MSSPLHRLVAQFFEKTAISRELVERAAMGSLQNRSFDAIERAQKDHAGGAARARKALKNRSITPETMRAIANREANHLKIQEIAKGLGEGREKALRTGTAAAVAEALPKPHLPKSHRLGGLKIPHINPRKLALGAGAGVLGLLAMRALAKRREVEDSYTEPY